MNVFRHLVALTLVVGSASLWAGCSAAEDTGSDEEDVTGACKVFFVKEDRFLTAAELNKLADPVAKKILQGKGCPTKLSDIITKLNTTDAKKCSQGADAPPPVGVTGDAGAKPAGPPPGTVTRFVSERSQELGAADSYRAVLTRECDGRSDHEFFISMFGIEAGGDLPNDVELIGEDKTKGVFDFYAREEGKWKFFGSSLNLIEDGYDCNADGACVPKAAVKTRCASCHVGGGLIMKELNTPWVNWEGDTQTPGVDDLFAKHKNILGGKGNGIEMEQKVTSGNATDWTPARIEFLKSKGTQELLRPLFCTLDLNLQSGQGTAQSDFFVDPIWNVFDSVSLTDYDAQIAANKQVIIDSTTGKAFKKKDGKAIVDTFFKFTYPERSTLDLSYVQQLISKNIIDDDFAKDVLFIDFTRPIFSKTRCDLLEFAPQLEASKMTPAAIQEGFKKNLTGKAGAAAELLKHVSAPTDAQAHQTAVQTYMQACTKRPGKDMTADVLAYASHLRNAIRGVTSKPEGQGGEGIIEFSETLATDSVPNSNKAFDPVTCTLK